MCHFIKKNIKKCLKGIILAGVTGIEPVNGEFRVHCLTAWLHPKS